MIATVLMISSVFYIMLVGCKLSDVDLKRIETCWSVSGLYVKVCISVLVHFWHYLLIYINK